MLQARRWFTRILIAISAGFLASTLYYGLSFVRFGLAAKLLGDAHKFGARLVGPNLLGHPWATILLVNSLLYAISAVLVFVAVDVLTRIREAFTNKAARRLVTFCTVHLVGFTFLFSEVDPADALGALLLSPGWLIAVWKGESIAMQLMEIAAVNAVVWVTAYAVLDALKAYRTA